MEYIKLLLKCKMWNVNLFGIILAEAIVGFFTLILLKNNTPEQIICLAWAIIYFGSTMVFYIFNNKLYTTTKRTLNLILYGMIALCALAVTIKDLQYQSVIIALCAIIVLTLRDTFNIKSYTRITELSLKKGLNLFKTLTVSSVTCTIILSLTYIMLSSIYQYNQNLKFIVFIIIIVVISTLHTKTKTSAQITEDKEIITLPKKMKLLLWLSGIYNAVTFTTYRFLIPIILVKATTTYNIQQSTFKYLGIILSVSALIGLVRISKKIQNTYTLTYKSYLLNLTLIASITILAVAASVTKTPILYIPIIILYLASQLVTRIYGVSYINTVRQVAEENKHQCKTYLQQFNIFKNLGGSLGFFILFCTINLVSVEITVAIMSLITMIIGIILNKKYNN